MNEARIRYVALQLALRRKWAGDLPADLKRAAAYEQFIAGKGVEAAVSAAQGKL